MPAHGCRERAAQAGGDRRHRLAYASREVEGKNLPKQEVILPRKTIIELSKLLEDTDDSVAIELSSAQAKFKFGNVVLVSKLVDGKFPDTGG